MTKKNKAIVVVLLLLCVVLIVSPVLALRGAEFGGSDDAGSVKVAEITGEYRKFEKKDAMPAKRIEE